MLFRSNTSAAATAKITQRDLTVSASAEDKVYDASTAAVAHLSTDEIAGDVVSASYGSANFVDKNVGVGKTVHVLGISIGGADAGNYNLTNTSAAATAKITQRDLTVSASAYELFPYTTLFRSAHLSTDEIAGDVVSASYGSANFVDKNVGVGKTV